MDLINPIVESYAEAQTSSENTLLKSIAEYTNANHREARMLSGHLQGRLLSMVSHMIRPRRILEIGTFTGYSALCLAEGLAEGGQLHTIELRENDAKLAQEYFNQSSYREQIILHTGSALDVIPALNETWDLVFIDADKPSYIQYFNLVLPNLRKNGFILADNVFFHGQVFEEAPKNKSARAMQAFNEMINERTDIDKTILTIRDGLYLVRKL